MELRQRKAQNLQPGAPDVPKSRRSSAEVRADKKKKEAVKEAAAVKTKAARARVEEARRVLCLEQAESDPEEEPVNRLKKVAAIQSKGQKTPATNTRGSKPKGKVNTKHAESSIEVAEPAADNSVSAKQIGTGTEYSLLPLVGG